jgi:hypothetical protein
MEGRTSFSEEKEAKRLLLRWRGAVAPPVRPTVATEQKFFGSFLQERTLYSCR